MAATLFAMRGRVALIRITKPPVNSLGLAVRKGIWEGIDQAEKANAAAVVLAGDGATFPAGADIGEFAKGGHMEFPPLGPVIERISALGMHTVAAVQTPPGPRNSEAASHDVSVQRSPTTPGIHSHAYVPGPVSVQ